MALLVLPLYIPILIFGVAAVEGEMLGLGGSAPLLILAAMLLLALALTPFATAAALPSGSRIGADPMATSSLHALANPLRFQKIADAVHPWVLAAVAVLAPGRPVVGALVVAPADYQQGDAYRIIFVHVPAAWMALFCYLVLAIASAAGLIWRHPLAEVAGRAAAPIGALLHRHRSVLTGSIWGKPMWGTWWVWDARLTSVLILFFLYLGYIALYDAFDDPARGARAASILALVGVVNLPIIKFSVDWWNTLHQPATVLRVGGPKIDPAMLWPTPDHGAGLQALLHGRPALAHARRADRPPHSEPAPAVKWHMTPYAFGREP